MGPRVGMDRRGKSRPLPGLDPRTVETAVSWPTSLSDTSLKTSIESIQTVEMLLGPEAANEKPELPVSADAISRQLSDSGDIEFSPCGRNYHHQELLLADGQVC